MKHKNSIFIYKTIIAIYLSVLIYNGSAQGSWTQKADWTGCYAQSNTAIAVNNKAYVGLGTAYCDDWREYDPSNNTWSQKDPLPSVFTETNMAFAINNNAYVLTGGGYINGNSEYKNELWEYNTSSENWTYLNDFPGDIVSHGASFSINGKGYICGGLKPLHNWVYSNELWEYDPTTNSWTQKADIIGTPVLASISFVADGIGYVGGGMTSIGNISQEFYSYDPLIDQWSPILSCPKNELFAASAFAINGKGYVGMGLYNGTNESPHQVWQYNPINDQWIRVADLPDNQCMWDEGIGFSINGKGYMGLGDVTCNNLPAGYYPYFYQYTPEINTSINTNSINKTKLNIEISPTISQGLFTLFVQDGSSNGFSYNVFDLTGKLILTETSLYNSSTKIDLKESPNGLYLLQVESVGRIYTKKIIIN